MHQQRPNSSRAEEHSPSVETFEGDQSPVENIATFAPGTIIADRFRIDTLLAKSALTSVYVATHVLLARRVSLRVLHRGGQTHDPNFVARCRAEAAKLSALNHSNVIKMLDAGETSAGDPFMVMDLVEGKPLSDALSHGPLEQDRIFRIGIELAQGLKRAHDLGVTHLDLKPNNIILVGDKDEETTKVVGLGLAGLLRGKRLIRPNLISVASANYMAPEQVKMEGVDARTDIYSLGAILFHMATGHPPFSAESGEKILEKHVNDPVPPAGCADRLEEVIQRCLRKDPLERFQTMREVANDLKQAWGAGRLAHDFREDTQSRPMAPASGIPQPLAPRAPSQSRRPLPVPMPPRKSQVPRPGSSPSMPAQPSGSSPGIPALSMPPRSASSPAIPAAARPTIPDMPAPEAARPFVSNEIKTIEVALPQIDDLHAPAPRNNEIRPVTWISLGLSVAAAVAAIAMLVLRNGGERAEPAAQPAQPAQQIAQPVQQAQPPQQQPQQEPARNIARVVFQSQPAGADVYDGDKRLGVTPFSVEITPSPTPHSFTFKRSGYLDAKLDSPIDEPGTTRLTAALRPANSSSRGAAPTVISKESTPKEQSVVPAAATMAMKPIEAAPAKEEAEVKPAKTEPAHVEAAKGENDIRLTRGETEYKKVPDAEEAKSAEKRAEKDGYKRDFDEEAPAPKEEAAPKKVPTTVMMRELVTKTDFALPPAVLKEFAGQKLRLVVLVCVGKSGAVDMTRTRMIASVPGANDAVLAAVQEWRYRPQPQAICGPITFDVQVPK